MKRNTESTSVALPRRSVASAPIQLPCCLNCDHTVHLIMISAYSFRSFPGPLHVVTDSCIRAHSGPHTTPTFERNTVCKMR